MSIVSSFGENLLIHTNEANSTVSHESNLCGMIRPWSPGQLRRLLARTYARIQATVFVSEQFARRQEEGLTIVSLNIYPKPTPSDQTRRHKRCCNWNGNGPGDDTPVVHCPIGVVEVRYFAWRRRHPGFNHNARFARSAYCRPEGADECRDRCKGLSMAM